MWSRWFIVWSCLAGIGMVTGVVGCAPRSSNVVVGGAGGASATGGAAGTSGNGGGGGGLSGSVDGGTDEGHRDGDGAVGPGCAETPASRWPGGALIEFPLQPFLEGKPFVFGESNALASGATLTPLNVRFYVSDVALVRADGVLVSADIVTGQGAMQAYGVHLFNADDSGSTTLRVRAPVGAYTAIRFLWGLTQACNGGLPIDRHPPLSETSQLTWPHLSFPGYLFLRYEARLTPASGATPGDDAGDAAAAVPPFAVIHMGGDPFRESAPEIRVTGTFSLSAAGSTPRPIRVVMDEIFRGAAANVDLTGFVGPGEEVVAGERLRRTTPSLEIFVFAP